jgi:predicted Zn-dependent peptidase
MGSDDLVTLTPHRSLVDGVPVYWTDTTTALPTIALIFRVGFVDERFGQRGVTHLVEHLALNDLRGAPYSFNGRVAATTTVFTASGNAEDLAAFVRDLCRNLRNLPLRRIRHEVQVLATEAQKRPQVLESQFLSIHCGYTQYGWMAMPELGLSKVSESDVAAWAAAMFTRDNLAVWIAGGLPESLTFDLPSGARVPAPEPIRIQSLQPPVFVTREFGGVALSALAEWSLPLKVGVLACQHRLHERLRFGEGLSYATLGDVNRLTKRTGHMILSSDCVTSAAGQTTAALLETVSAVAANGHKSDDLRQAIAATRRAFSTDRGVPAVLDQWAYHELAGFEQETVGAMLDRIEAMEARAVAVAVTRAMNAAVLVIPVGCEPPDQRFRPYLGPTAAVLRGRTFHKQRRALLNFGPQVNYIAINQDGVTHVNEQGKPTTVFFNRCAGMLKFGEGKRLILGEDSQVLEFIPKEWPDGLEIGNLLDAAVPDERIIWCRW